MTGISRRSLMIGAAAGAGALALGTYWLNKSGQRQDLFTILKSYGLTAISLRATR